MVDTPLLHRFEEFGELTVEERDAILKLGRPPYQVVKGRCIQRENAPTEGFYLLMSGWAAAARLLPGGSRQILKVHLAGDALGTPSMATSHTTEELVAITDVIVSKVTLEQFGKLISRQPRISVKFLLSIQYERIALMDRLAAIGRTSAESRVAAMFLDLQERLIPLDLVSNGGFNLPLTQEQIGDVLGITGIHVNRVIRSLTKQGLIGRVGRRVQIMDKKALDEVASRTMRRPFADQSWLPPAP